MLEPFDAMDDLLRQTRVMLVPSLWAEARSRVILEAMSRGIPVMASNVGGLAEAKLGIDYLLPVNPVAHYRSMVDELMVPMAEIPPQDVQPWATALERLLTDRQRYEQLSAESRAAALEYASRLSAAPFESYLRKVLRSPKRRPLSASGSARKPHLSDERRRLLANAFGKRATRCMWPTERYTEDRAGQARRATEIAREALPGVDIEILWDGMWVRGGGADFFPDPEMFRVSRNRSAQSLGRAGAKKYLLVDAAMAT